MLVLLHQYLLISNHSLFDLNGGSSTNNNIAADNKPEQTYVSTIKGDLCSESRNYIQHISNNPDNKYGDIIHI